jgi:hypothetical protein
MNFKVALFLAGVIAATAESIESSQQMVEESSPAELAERCSKASMSVSPSKCARCRGAPQRRAARFRSAVNWRNGQNRANSRWWSAQVKYRNNKVRYWNSLWWPARVRQYHARRNYISRTYAAWYRRMIYNYNHCK